CRQRKPREKGDIMPRRLIRTSVIAVILAFGAVANAEAQGRGRGAPVNLPEGTGKDLVQATCSRCHVLNLIVNDGYSNQEWQYVISTMVDLPKNDMEVITTYLAAHFPEKPKPAAMMIPGSADVSFKEWPLPTKGSRPHDPLATPDGGLWYTGMFANKLGRVDTKTGQITEYPLPIEGSGPHGLVADKSGNIMFTANSKGY